jgi:rubrerythrin
MPDRDAASDHLREKARTRTRARCRHQGGGHWHVERRSTVIICRACGARVPRRLDPQSCPECGAGA